MQEKDKHKIYSKEELLKIIKEGESVPADMDDFDREALEGLKLLNNEDVLNKINTQVDYIVELEKRKKKTVYYFSAAASFLLIVGLVFFFKNSFNSKDNKPIALAEKPKEENLPPSLTIPPQAETKPTHGTKEHKSEKQDKIISTTKKEGYLSNQVSSSPNVIADKMVNEGLEKADQSDESKSVKDNDNHVYRKGNQGPPQSKHEEQAIVANETETTSNNTTSSGSGNDVAAKQTQNLATNNQPTQDALSNANTTPTEIPPADKKQADEKSKKSVSSYARGVDGGSTKKSYTEPTFMGRDSAFTAYAKQNLKISSSGNSGIIVVSFLVTKDGAAEKIEVTKPLTNCTACSDDVINLIKSVKKWQPAIVNGKPIDATKKINIQYN
ncbi:MAG TPA: energy transducer TonB [Bacteroidia bacterium]